MALLGFVLGALLLTYFTAGLLIYLMVSNGFSGGLGDALWAWWLCVAVVASMWYLLFKYAPFTLTFAVA